MAANPFADPDVPTLAEVLRRVQADEHLPPARKRELASAIHTAARGLHRTPEEIPGSPAFLRRALARHSAAEFGVGHGRFRNIRSLLKRALEVSGVAPTGYLAPWPETGRRSTIGSPTCTSGSAWRASSGF